MGGAAAAVAAVAVGQPTRPLLRRRRRRGSEVLDGMGGVEATRGMGAWARAREAGEAQVGGHWRLQDPGGGGAIDRKGLS